MSPSWKGRTSISALFVTISASERHEDDGSEIGGGADAAAHEVGDRPAAETEPEHGGEEDADGAEGEADQLGVLVGVRERLPAALAHRPLLHAAGRLRGGLAGPLAARHEGALRGLAGQSFRPARGWNAAVSIPK